jgi:hypothetical protein
MEDKIIPFKPRAAKKAAPVEPIADRTLFWLDHEVAELTLTIPKAEPTPPRVRY